MADLSTSLPHATNAPFAAGEAGHLSAHDELADYVETLRQTVNGRVVSTVPPSWAGARTNTWHPTLGLYNGESPTLRAARRKVAMGRAGRLRCHLACVGDSKTAGVGSAAGGASSPLVMADAYPGQLIDLLGAYENCIFPNHGTGSAGATAGGDDTRWTFSSTVVREGDNSGRYFYVKVNGDGTTGTATVTLPVGAWGFRIWGWKGSTAGRIDHRTDGGASVSWVPSTTGWGYTEVINLNSAVTHTVEMTLVGTVALLAVEIITGGAHLQISNAGMAGSFVSDWLNTGAFNQPYSSLTEPTTFRPDVALLNLGTNYNATTVADLATLVSRFAGVGSSVILVAPGGTELSSNYLTLRDAYYDLADSQDLPLVDLSYLIGAYPTANTAGLMADVLHENAAGYTLEAAALARVLAF